MRSMDGEAQNGEPPRGVAGSLNRTGPGGGRAWLRWVAPPALRVGTGAIWPSGVSHLKMLAHHKAFREQSRRASGVCVGGHRLWARPVSEERLPLYCDPSGNGNAIFILQNRD
ncbi:hypothetical protein SEVIR_9G574450v4 [Setaria viridis]